MSIHKPYLFSRITLAFIVCASLLLIYFFRWEEDRYLQTVNGDGGDYYSYLLSVFINQDLGNQDTSPWFVIPTETGTINVHTIGVSLLLTPFFGIGYICALVIDADLDGMSEPFLKMVSIGALFYAVLGLFFLKKLLAAFRFSDKMAAVVMLMIYFGTNLLVYTVYEPSMSHVYSFSMITVFLYYAKKLMDEYSGKYLYLASFVLGLIILIRPVNGIIVFAVPFLASSFEEFKSRLIRILKSAKQLILACSIMLAVLFLQSLVWYAQNGNFVQWSYKGNGFYFNDPHTFLMLFGFDSGFFIYTPLCLLVMLGFIPLFRQNRFRAVTLLLFLAFCFYLFSCYWGYTYFEGIGIRTFVDFYALFAILLAMFLFYVKNTAIRFTGIAIASLFSIISLIFCYQYQAGILARAGMNFNKFKYIFMETDPAYAGILGGCMDLEPYTDGVPEKVMEYTTDSVYKYENNEYGLGCTIDSVEVASNKFYVKVNLKRKEETAGTSQMAMLVVHVEAKDGASKSYQAYKLNEIPPDTCGTWEEMSYRITVADKVYPGDKLSVYIWNKERQKFLISDFNVEVYNYNFKTS